ncbi:MAG: hypothetical protein ACKVOM_02260 [Ferruginibacter sp.]
MKKILFIPLLLSFLAFYSCNKSIKELEAPAKVDVLFSQVKNDAIFLEYLKEIDQTIDLFRKQIQQSNPSDSQILRDNSLSLDDKFGKLKYQGLDKVKENSNKIVKLFDVISKKYPAIPSLSNEESKLLYKKVYSYYAKPLSTPKKLILKA